MNRVEAYLDAAKAADTPQQLLEAIAKLLEGASRKERELLSVQLDVVVPAICKLSDEEKKFLELMAEQRKQGNPAAIIGSYVLLFRAIMVGLCDYLNGQPLPED